MNIIIAAAALVLFGFAMGNTYGYTRGWNGCSDAYHAMERAIYLSERRAEEREEILARMRKKEAKTVTWQEAMRVIRQECNSHEHCDACPAKPVCGVEYPPKWDMSKLGGEADD